MLICHSGLRFASFPASLNSAPLAHIRELHLEECLLTVDNLYDIFDDPGSFSGLQELYLSGNELTTLSARNNRHSPCILSLTSLVLENNCFLDLDCLASVTRMFPRVKAVSLQANRISKETQTGSTSNNVYPQIESLNVSHNLIDSYAFIDSLPQVLPNLSSLRISNNPLFTHNEQVTGNDPRASDQAFYLTLARVPTLQTLDYAKISARDRQEGEIYYLSIADKDIQALFSRSNGTDKDTAVNRAKISHPQYQTLAAKYDRVSVIEQFLHAADADSTATADAFKTLEHIFPIGSLGARLVTATFYLVPTVERTNTNPEITLELPSSIPATKLMSILLQHPAFQTHLRPLQFNLFYESTELDPVDTTAESTTKSAVHGKRLTPEEKRTLWKEFGDWDADAIMEEALRQDAVPTIDEPGDQAVTRKVDEHWTSDGQHLIRQGRRWKRREVEIPHALKRPWGDWIDEAREVRIRIEPFARPKWGA